jgi:hypothetical protein
LAIEGKRASLSTMRAAFNDFARTNITASEIEALIHHGDAPVFPLSVYATLSVYAASAGSVDSQHRPRCGAEAPPPKILFLFLTLFEIDGIL